MELEYDNISEKQIENMKTDAREIANKNYEKAVEKIEFSKEHKRKMKKIFKKYRRMIKKE